MADSFNPYHVWLGIPPAEQPANYYRLLGLGDFESNVDVIASASDQRMAFLRSLQIGKHRTLSQTLLNEVSAATACLLSETRRAQYDQKLRQQLAERAKHAESKNKPPATATRPAVPVAIPVARPIPPTSVRLIDVPVAPPRRPATLNSPEIPAPPPAPRLDVPLWQHSVPVWQLLAGAGAAAVCFAVAIVIFVGSRRSTKPIAQPPSISSPAESSEIHLPVAPDKPANGSKQPKPAAPEPSRPSSPASPSKPARLPLIVKRTFSLPDEDEMKAASLWFAEKYREQMYGPIFENNQMVRPGPQPLALADLFTKDAQTEISGPLVHALLIRARESWARGGEVDAALEVADGLARTFQLSEPEKVDVRLYTYVQLRGAPLWTPAREVLADRLMAEVDEALNASDFGRAEECGNLALDVTRPLRKPERKAAVIDQRTKIAQTRLAKYEQAKSVLKKDPANPEANLVVAKFLCGPTNDWDKGLPHLAASGDPALAPVLSSDRAAVNAGLGPQATELQLAAADAYYDWDIRTKHTDRDLLRLIRRRGSHWYNLALKNLKDPARRQAAQRRRDHHSHFTLLPMGQFIPGLSGSVDVKDASQPGRLQYRPGDLIAAAEFADLLKDLRPTDEVRIVLEGRVYVNTAGELSITVNGDPKTVAKHQVHFGSEQLLSIGDNSLRSDSRRLQLEAGSYSLKWELSGREIGSASLEVKRMGPGGAPLIGLDPRDLPRAMHPPLWEETLGQAAIPYRAPPAATKQVATVSPAAPPPPPPVRIVPPRQPLRKFAMPSDDERVAAMMSGAKEYQLGDRSTSALRIALVEQLAKEVQRLNDEPTADSGPRIYWMLDIIREMRAREGDLHGALRAVDQMAQMFSLPDMQVVGYRFNACTTFEHSLTSAVQRESLALQVYKEVENALHLGVYSSADFGSLFWVRVTKEMGDVHRQRAAQLREKVVGLKPAFENLHQWKEILRKDPENPEANLAAAKFLCNVLKNYQQGLPHLVAAKVDREFSIIVALDRKAAEAPSGTETTRLQMTAANAWYDWWQRRADKSDLELMFLVRFRANHWYLAALPALKGEDRKFAEQRQKDVHLIGGVPLYPN